MLYTNNCSVAHHELYSLKDVALTSTKDSLHISSPAAREDPEEHVYRRPLGQWQGQTVGQGDARVGRVQGGAWAGGLGSPRLGQREVLWYRLSITA